MVPGLMVMLLTMLTGFLPALNIVGEKETGTIEQMNVSPVRPWTLILSKLIPYWTLGLFVLMLAMGLAANTLRDLPQLEGWAISLPSPCCTCW